jgi:hypothetical protein
LLIELEKAILASEGPGREFVRNEEDVARSGSRVDLFSEADGARECERFTGVWGADFQESVATRKGIRGVGASAELEARAVGEGEDSVALFPPGVAVERDGLDLAVAVSGDAEDCAVRGGAIGGGEELVLGVGGFRLEDGEFGFFELDGGVELDVAGTDGREALLAITESVEFGLSLAEFGVSGFGVALEFSESWGFQSVEEVAGLDGVCGFHMDIDAAGSGESVCGDGMRWVLELAVVGAAVFDGAIDEAFDLHVEGFASFRGDEHGGGLGMAFVVVIVVGVAVVMIRMVLIGAVIMVSMVFMFVVVVMIRVGAVVMDFSGGGRGSVIVSVGGQEAEATGTDESQNRGKVHGRIYLVEVIGALVRKRSWACVCMSWAMVSMWSSWAS